MSKHEHDGICTQCHAEDIIHANQQNDTERLDELERYYNSKQAAHHASIDPSLALWLIGIARKGFNYDEVLKSGEYFRNETVEARKRAEKYEKALRWYGEALEREMVEDHGEVARKALEKP